MAQVIVVGGGLSGLSAAHTVLERGGRVVVIDKAAFFGGNSTKATSGINGALTNTQRALGIQDSPQAFYDDTAKSARDLIDKDHVKTLTYNSASAVEWLQDKFRLDLSLVSRLGGHSFPRTHRGKEKFPGATITFALMDHFETVCKAEPNRARAITRARVTKLLQNSNGHVIGVEYDQGGMKGVEHGTVVLATGGYAADFAEDGLLRQHRPDLLHLPTTNGEYTSGDGHKMAMKAGANGIHMSMVQVHPTGLVDPREPDAKTKFLAAEALRGVGGLLLDANGKRFADELGHRDYVTGRMNANKGPFRLVLNSKASKEIAWHCKHYESRGLMKRFASGEVLAREMGISPAVLERTFNDYNAIACGDKKDPFGKRFFHNTPITMDDEFHVAIVTPVLHYTMGGISATKDAEVKKPSGEVIPGLYVAGEIVGGVHGANRLGGSSLLGCVVYGRVAGASASRHLLEQLVQNPSAGAAGGKSPLRIDVDPVSGKLHMEISFAGTSAGGSAIATTSSASSSVPSSSAKAPTPAAKPAPKLQEYTIEDVAKHNKESDCWIIVNGQVLDVTSFLKDHPGGKKAILIYAGKDSSEEFNMLHPANTIAKHAPHLVIGTVKGAKGTSKAKL